MSYTLDISTSLSAPNLNFVDSTTYPGSGNHAISNLVLYALRLTSLTGGTNYEYTTEAGLDGEVVSAINVSGLDTSVEVADGLYSIMAIVIPSFVISTAYAAGDVVFYNDALYLCVTGGTPATTPDASVLFELITDEEDITARYIGNTYACVLFGMIISMKESGFAYLREHCNHCNPLCTNADASKFFRAMVLMQDINVFSLTHKDLALYPVRNKVIENFSKLEMIFS